MNEKTLFQMALGLSEPWYVSDTKFDPAIKRLDIHLDFHRGGMFPCPVCGVSCKAYDTEEKTWRHLNFFQHEAYLHARIPRIECGDHGVRMIDVSWGRPQSGFTMLFEALVLMLAREMPVKAIADLMGVTDHRIWRVLTHYVEADLERQDLSGTTAVGVDETAARRGHDYVSLFADMGAKKVVFVTEGKDAATVAAFADHLEAHGGTAAAITEVTCDMSPAFIAGVGEHLPQASLTFDKFHVIKTINDAVDAVRREEQRTEPDLKSTRYLWLKNPGKLTVNQLARLLAFPQRKCRTARAYRMKLILQEIYRLDHRDAEPALWGLYQWALRSRLEPMVAFGKMLRRHWDGVMRWYATKQTNALLEGLNSLVQAARTRARGYRSFQNFRTMIYLIAGHMGLLPT
jgi:transposase